MDHSQVPVQMYMISFAIPEKKKKILIPKSFILALE